MHLHIHNMIHYEFVYFTHDPFSKIDGFLVELKKELQLIHGFAEIKNVYISNFYAPSHFQNVLTA